MKKINKIICCLIMPVLAIFGLAGCGHARTAADIKNRYAAIKEHHAEMFMVKDDVVTDTIKVSYTGEMTNLDNLDNWKDEFANDNKLYNRYYALVTYQDAVLETLFTYYEAQRDAFFGNELLGVEKKEMKQLYNNVEKFEEDIKAFKVAKSKVENTVNVMTFTGVVRADITSYAYEYNMLIENCFEYVRYFKDLNTKYAYSGEVTDVNRLDYVKHYYEEAIFELTEVMYYRYIKAANNVNECDLSNIINYETEVFAYEDDLFEEMFDDGNLMDSYKKYIDVIDKNPNVTSQFKNNVEKFQESRDSFMQKLRVFKQVYENMDYYNYNLALVENRLDEYKDKATNIEKANINLVEAFYNTTVSDYITKLMALQLTISA